VNQVSILPRKMPLAKASTIKVDTQIGYGKIFISKLIRRTNLRTAQQCREEADRRDQMARESFERCDTDGFLSQNANAEAARCLRKEADIIENDGLWFFTGLYEGDRRVAAKSGVSETQYGYSFYWLLDDSEVDLIRRRGKKFLPQTSASGTSRVQSSLGLREVSELAPAKTGYNANGIACIKRAGDEWGRDAKLMSDPIDRQEVCRRS